MNINQIAALAPIITLSTATIALMLTIAIRRNFVLASSVASFGILMSLLAIASKSRIDSVSLFMMSILVEFDLLL